MMQLKKWFSLICVGIMLAVASVFIGGCGSSEKTQPSDKVVMSFTDLEGRKIDLTKQPQRFVVGDYITNYLLVGGAASLDKVVGVTGDGWQDVRYGEYVEFTKAFPKLKSGDAGAIPSIGGYHDNVLDAEKIISLKPDVLIMDKTQYTENNQKIDTFEKAGIKVVVLDYHAETIDNHTKSTEILGKLLDREKVAQDQIGTYTQAVDVLHQRIEALSADKKNKKVFMEIGNKGTGEYGNSYNNHILWGAIIHDLQGDNISGNMKTKYAPLDREMVTAANPDIIIIGGSIWAKDTKNDQMRMGFTVDESLAQERLRGFAAIPDWKNLNAIKNGEVYGVDHGSLRTMVDYTLFQYIAKIMYPETFADINPQQNMHDFYAKYLPELKYHGTFMTKLQ